MTKNKKGFTIIEVVLVLAIAGLIFLMVFIALPALQRSQRNTRRRQDMARILSAFTDYQSVNNGRMPGTEDKDVDDFLDRYVGADGSDQRKDPDGEDYTMKAHGKNEADGTKYYGGAEADEEKGITHKIHYWNTAVCGSTEGTVDQGKGDRDVAIFYYLEGGAIYCGDNQ